MLPRERRPHEDPDETGNREELTHPEHERPSQEFDAIVGHLLPDGAEADLHLPDQLDPKGSVGLRHFYAETSHLSAQAPIGLLEFSERFSAKVGNVNAQTTSLFDQPPFEPV